MKPLLEHNFSARVLNAGLENDKGIFEPSVFDLNHESINEKYDQCLQRLREHDSRVFLEDYVPPTRSIGDATSSKHSKLSTPLRKRIEETIGKQILDKYWHGTRGPIMMPPIPTSKFIDRLSQNEVLHGMTVQEKEHQDAYSAEVILYRCLEEVNGNYLVIHQLEYTHIQYSAFLPKHLCDKMSCKKGAQDHLCHKRKDEIEGECDFVVVGYCFVAIFEVKALAFQDTEVDNIKFEGCRNSARMQRKRMNNLMKSIDPSVTIYEFTVFPNISTEEVEEQYLSDETVLFSDDIENLVWIIDCCEAFTPVAQICLGLLRYKLSCSLLGLWCIKQDNKWNLDDCILSTEDSLITHEAKRNESKRKKGKEKKYSPTDVEMVQAPLTIHKNSGLLTQLDAKESLESQTYEEKYVSYRGLNTYDTSRRISTYDTSRI